jgi:hypothetical protein
MVLPLSSGLRGEETSDGLLSSEDLKEEKVEPPHFVTIADQKAVA